ncbi:restriction endonuclease subunit S, partial [Enterococcus faecium]|nr:restriction endonuclease subunit S [Enterococcus faecium]
SEFLKLNLNVPYDIEEQKKIGTFFKQLDDTIALHQRKLDLLKETKKGFLQKMFPKNGAKVPEIRFPGFTEDWEQRKLGEMVKQFSIKSKKEDEYTVLSSTNSGMEIRDGRVSGTSNLGYKIVEDGDLVLSPQNLWLGNININDIGKGLVSPSYKTFKFTNINSAFLKPQLHTSKMLEEYKNSSTQGASIVRRNLELDSFYQIPMLVPTTEEQSKLGVFFESMDNTITLHQRELDSLKEMKKSLLQQMFV